MIQNARQLAYLLLAAAGVIVTWYFNLRFMAESGGTFSLVEFVRAGNANSAASSLANDLLVGTVTFLIWSYTEARRLGMRYWWAFVLLTFCIAFATAFPLFLYARDRALHRVPA